jgi:hypothetical protein
VSARYRAGIDDQPCWNHGTDDQRSRERRPGTPADAWQRDASEFRFRERSGNRSHAAALVTCLF